MALGQFSQIDYILFVIVIVISSSIGLYYAIKQRQIFTTTVDDYLLGGRNMGLFPIVCSLASTSLSATSFVGVSSETYAYGSHVWMYAYGATVMGFLVSWIFLPVFYNLKLTSVFKYFELRFNRRVRQLASGLYLLSGVIYLSVTVYIPSLCFEQVTGVNIYATVIVLSVVCTIYTAIGGFKAVIWTDVVQLVFMSSSMSIIIAVGIRSANGFDNVIDAAHRGGRDVIFNYNIVNSRTSFWGHIFSSVILSIYQFGLNQTNIQRYMAFKNLKSMRISVWILVVLISIFFCVSSFLGIIVYANYETCDPFTANMIKKIDHIVPHFIQEKASLFHGFNGIFIAGIFAASLSTMSSYLNAMSGIIYEDFISLIYPNLKGNMPGKIMKTTVLIIGIAQIGLIFFIEKMGTIIQIVSQCMTLNTCALITLFFLGIFIPKANSKGALFGAVASITFTLTLIIGSINAKREPTIPFRTDGCDVQIELNQTSFTSTQSADINIEHSEVFWIFKINYIYFALIGTIVGLCVGCIVSFLTGRNTVKDQRLIAKFLQKNQLSPDEQIYLRIGNNL